MAPIYWCQFSNESLMQFYFNHQKVHLLTWLKGLDFPSQDSTTIAISWTETIIYSINHLFIFFILPTFNIQRIYSFVSSASTSVHFIFVLVMFFTFVLYTIKSLSIYQRKMFTIRLHPQPISKYFICCSGSSLCFLCLSTWF